MSDAPRDWDRELAKIDRLIEQGKGAPPPAKAAGGKAAPAAGPQSAPALPAPPRGKKDIAGAWLRVLLGVALGAGMTQWPYDAHCGTGLFLYLAPAALVVLVGLWSAATAWRRRIGLAHVISLLVVLWGLVLVAQVVLPRTGYLGSHLPWGCG